MSEVEETLRRHWGLDAEVVRPLGGGMNSETWRVEAGGTTYVAKRVAPAALDDLVNGCAVAHRLADRGFVTGRPRAALDGRLVVTEHALALLEHVPGRELDGETDDEQRWMATTLAGVHAAGEPTRGPGTADFMAAWLDGPAVAGVPWLPAAVGAVRAETESIELTWSGLHTDPAPEAFVHDDATGVTGLIDWTGARRGPVLYDVASAVMYLGRPQEAVAFLDTYAARGPLGAEEFRHLDALRRFRWVVQAAYFAERLRSDDLTGLSSRAGNTGGLDDARRGLAALGLPVPG